jgi:hypothetical protein
MILCVKVRFNIYEENKKNYVKFEFNFDGLGVGNEIRQGLDFLSGLCYCLTSLHSLFMKDFALTGRSSWVFHFSILSYRPLSETC